MRAKRVATQFMVITALHVRFESNGMKIYLCLLTIVLSFACGCSNSASSAGSVESRRQSDIDFYQRHISHERGVPALAYAGILSTLKSVSAQAMRSPTIASAILEQSGDESLTLHLHWVEDQPSADGAAVVLGNGSPIVFGFYESELKGNRKEAQHSVVYAGGHVWKSGSEEAKQLMAAGAPVELQARLLSGERPLTAWFRVTVVKRSTGKQEGSEGTPAHGDN